MILEEGIDSIEVVKYLIPVFIQKTEIIFYDVSVIDNVRISNHFGMSII